MKYLILPLIILTFCAQAQTVLVPDRVFDGEEMHNGWVVEFEGGYITYVGKEKSDYGGAQIMRLPGQTVMPGMIEGHSHLLLHPYNETGWNEQVLNESRAERVARATVHAKKTLLAGFTTVRDLGSEGAAYADVGLKEAIDKGIIPGPRMVVAGRAIVATGSYGPKGFAPDWDVPLGAEPADGHDDLIRVVRDQIGKGVGLIKVYADYRWGPNGEARPTFSVGELKLIVQTAASSGRQTVAHASSAEAMERAILAGVSTIEHGDGATEQTFRLMAEAGIALCPTLAAGDAIMQYRGWNKGVDPDPERIKNKKQSFAMALKAGVSIVAGGDVGVFSHGDNVRELEMMVEYGMSEIESLKSVTSINAQFINLDNQIGTLKSGMVADIISVEGDPSKDISVLRKIMLVYKEGNLIKD